MLARVAPRPYVPEELKHGPFTLAQARLAGVTWEQLQSRAFRRLAHATYAWTGLTAEPMLMLEAALHRLPPVAVISGPSAAWLHGLDVTPCDPIQVTLPKACGASSRSGVHIRRATLDATEVVIARGLRTTSMVRTLLDIAEGPSVIESVVVYDMALRARSTTAERLQAATKLREGTKYAKRLRQVLQLTDPRAESPMESRLRTILCLAVLPHPQLQVKLFDSNSNYLGRADLYYPDQRLVIEFDGATHRHSLVDDNRRQNRILAAGYRLLRYTSADLRNPLAVAAQVRAALIAGHPGISGKQRALIA